VRDSQNVPRLCQLVPDEIDGVRMLRQCLQSGTMASGLSELVSACVIWNHFCGLRAVEVQLHIFV
jgi:hypothetical protein